MSYAFSPAAPVTLPIRGSDDVFPVRRVYCVGRNYAAHAVEMGSDPDKEPPFFFQKNPDNLTTGGHFPYPVASSDVHHEIELLVFLSKGGDHIPVGEALNHVYGYAVGLDMTRRDLQSAAKKTGRPWESGKAFEKSAPCGEIVRADEIGHPEKGAIWLKVNDKTVQEGDLGQLIWKVPEVIAHLSSLFSLAPGDVIMTGTPAGVGPVSRGDNLVGRIEGIGEFSVSVG